MRRSALFYGSNAIPGNKPSSSSPITQDRNEEPAVGVQTTLTHDEPGSEIVSFEAGVEALNFNGPVQSSQVLPVDDTRSAEESSSLASPPESLPSPLVAPLARTAVPRDLMLTEGSFDDLALPNEFYRNSLNNLRTKTTNSRASRGGAGGSETPGTFSEDWIEIRSQASGGSSKIANILYSYQHSAKQFDVPSITYDELCKFLEETGDRNMVEDELILICQRILNTEQTFIKALADLPLFIKIFEHKENALRINGILYSYLSQSDGLFEDLKRGVDPENGSVSSTCSQRGAGSTICSIQGSPVVCPLIDDEVMSDISSPSPRIVRSPESSSPVPLSLKSTHLEEENKQTEVPRTAIEVNRDSALSESNDDYGVYKDLVESSSAKQQHPISYIDEIKEAQSHVPHPVDTTPSGLKFYLCNNNLRFGRFSQLSIRPQFRYIENPKIAFENTPKPKTIKKKKKSFKMEEID